MGVFRSPQAGCLFGIVILLCVVFVSSNMCTDVLKRYHIEEITIKVPCTEKYVARCGWLSLNYCTFYRSTFCDKEMNDTKTTYYIVTDCCKGFFKAKNGTCLKKQPGVDYSYLTPSPLSPNTNVTEDPKYIPAPQQRYVTNKKSSGLSGGGYAGIACGFVFFICVVAFTINGILKRKRRLQKFSRQKPPEQVLYVGPVNGSMSRVVTPTSLTPDTPLPQSSSTPVPVISINNSDETQARDSPVSVQSSRSKTPQDGSEIEETESARVTPLLSQVSGEVTPPADIEKSKETGATPLLLAGQTVDDIDDIPESDV